LGFTRARWTARCTATMVFPVPAERETRAGPAQLRSTSSHNNQVQLQNKNIRKWFGKRGTVAVIDGLPESTASEAPIFAGAQGLGGGMDGIVSENEIVLVGGR
jgi:hypothetical protein